MDASGSAAYSGRAAMRQVRGAWVIVARSHQLPARSRHRRRARRLARGPARGRRAENTKLNNGSAPIHIVAD
jgi:hypothetical protein